MKKYIDMSSKETQIYERSVRIKEKRKKICCEAVLQTFLCVCFHLTWRALVFIATQTCEGFHFFVLKYVVGKRRMNFSV
jgi:hypothetical protein